MRNNVAKNSYVKTRTENKINGALNNVTIKQNSAVNWSHNTFENKQFGVCKLGSFVI